jgi:hypothetical protein
MKALEVLHLLVICILSLCVCAINFLPALVHGDHSYIFRSLIREVSFSSTYARHECLNPDIHRALFRCMSFVLSVNLLGAYILLGDLSNFKRYCHVACHISPANLRSLFVKTRPRP